MNTGWLYEVDYQGMCHEPDDQQIAAKCLHQSVVRDLCQYIPLCISADERWIIFDRLWHYFALFYCLNLKRVARLESCDSSLFSLFDLQRLKKGR